MTAHPHDRRVRVWLVLLADPPLVALALMIPAAAARADLERHLGEKGD